MQKNHLSAEQVEQFLTRGHITLHNCFPRQRAEQWVAQAWKRMGMDPDNPATWVTERLHMPTTLTIELKDLAPRAWQAACELLGGEDRVLQPCTTGDGLIVNFGIGRDRPWSPPGASSPGWHKDGDFFLHFLDSPEQGLLTLVIWTDIEPQGGGTFVACDSVGPVARYLEQHPEGVR
ncbi:MAG TPA: hypothetical protein VGS41_01850, partial [Chthonomonadales bacterium]|nr:hypothetical protein [Chthonomonadales bacterium]